MGVSPKRTLQNSNFLTTHAGHLKFSGYANIKKSFLKWGFPKLKLFNHGIKVPNFNFPIWSNLCISAPSASSERCFSSAGLTVRELRVQLSDEHLEALNVMKCNKALL